MSEFLPVVAFAMQLLGPQLATALGLKFSNANDTEKVLIIYYLLIISCGSASNLGLTFVSRQDDFLGGGRGVELPWTTSPELVSALAAGGLYRPELQSDSRAGSLLACRCFHCGQRVGFPALSAAMFGDNLQDAVCLRHREASPACAMARLAGFASDRSAATAAEAFGGSGGVAILSRSANALLRRLRPLLDGHAIAQAASYGFNTLYLNYCLTRHCIKTGDGEQSLPLTSPGEIIFLAQQVESEAGGEALIDLTDFFDVRRLIELLGGGQQHQQQILRQPVPVVTAATAAPTTSTWAAAAAAAAVAASALAAEADDRCVQCRERVRNRVALPCAHFVACDRCLQGSARCQLCQREILATVVAYIT